MNNLQRFRNLLHFHYVASQLVLYFTCNFFLFYNQKFCSLKIVDWFVYVHILYLFLCSADREYALTSDSPSVLEP